MSVTNDDIIEDGRGLTIEELTKEYLQTISPAITSYRVKKDCPITKHQVIFNNQPLFCIKTPLNEFVLNDYIKSIKNIIIENNVIDLKITGRALIFIAFLLYLIPLIFIKKKAILAK